jgi:putative holliday junction resolvase
MQKLLSLDVGRRHTGVGFCNTEMNVAMPLDTIHHTEAEELVGEVAKLVEEREVSTIVIGMPLFMSGDESEQTRYTRSVADLIQEACPDCKIEYIDERGTSNLPQLQKSKDPNAQAATEILRMFMERNL